MTEINLDQTKFKNGVYFLSEPEKSFESIYIEVREKEKRVYSDEEVKHLPNTSNSNPHKEEWNLRKRPMQRFTNYLQKFSSKINLLDIGCGNGWFSANIARINSNNVYALDVNAIELEQAARVFNFDGLYFIYGNIFDNIFEDLSFDIITLNSSIQYFDDLEKIINRLFYFLIDDGEIHIMDSPIYNLNELVGAKERTARYFISIGLPEMAKHYNHHTFNALKDFNYKTLYNPNAFQNNIKKIFGFKDSPFPWIIIKK